MKATTLHVRVAICLLVLVAASTSVHAGPAPISPLRVYGLYPAFLSESSSAHHLSWKLRLNEDVSLQPPQEENEVSRAATEIPVAWQINIKALTGLRAGEVVHDSGVVEGHRGHVTLHRDATSSSSSSTSLLPTLPSFVRYSYSLRVRDAAGRWSPWSEDAAWNVGPGPSLSDWGGATWLCTSPNSTDIRSSMLRTEFTLPAGKQATGATAYVVGLGQFQFRMNGVDVGGDWNVPGQTTWAKRILYSTYMVPTSLLLQGASNAIGIVLGNGMYNVPVPPQGRYTKWTGSYGSRVAIVKLIVDFSDGSSMEVDSTPSSSSTSPSSTFPWLATDGGPIVYSHNYAGEDYNASLAVPGWDAPGFNPSTSNPLVAWTNAVNCTGNGAPPGLLLPSSFDPVRVMETLYPINITQTAGSSALVDVGRNFAGSATVTVTNVPPGYSVRVWPSETMYEGEIHQESGGTPMYWQYFPATQQANSTNSSSSASSADPLTVTLSPTFSEYGWRWLEVQILPPPTTTTTSTTSDIVYNGTMTILQASYGVCCNAALVGDETAAVGAFCNGLEACNFTVCTCGDNTCGTGTPKCIPDPAQNCAKDFSVVYTCSKDAPGTNRSWYVPAEADNQMLPLTCGPMPPPPPAPIFPNVTFVRGHFARASMPTVGTFSSSNTWVNSIMNITVEAFAANAASVLKDCPHRERLGWLEVSHLIFPSIAFTYDISRVWGKMVYDTVDSQLPSGMVPDIAPEYVVFSGGFRDSPEWGSASILNPAFLYSWYGDEVSLNATYATGVKYTSYLTSMLSSRGTLDYGLGDWIPVVTTPTGVTGTAIFVQDLCSLAEAATVLGRPGDATNFTALAAKCANAYEAAFWSNSTFYPTQCTAGMGLTLGITKQENVAAAQAYLLNDVISKGNISTSGEIGNRFALLALGNLPGGVGVQAVWDSLLRTTGPGYGNMLTMGETALAESWTDAQGDSHIHAMYGHISEFLWAYIAGIQQMKEGDTSTSLGACSLSSTSATIGGSGAWSRVLIAPKLVRELEWVNVTFDSPRGLVEASYFLTSRSETETLQVEMTVSVAPGVEGWVEMPISHERVRIPRGGVKHVLREEGVDPRRR